MTPLLPSLQAGRGVVENNICREKFILDAPKEKKRVLPLLGFFTCTNGCTIHNDVTANCVDAISQQLQGRLPLVLGSVVVLLRTYLVY